jgi:hypothetical protein
MTAHRLLRQHSPVFIASVLIEVERMSSFEIHWLPNEGLVFGKFCTEFDFRRDLNASAHQLTRALDQAGGPVPYILDITDLEMSFGDMVSTMAELTRGDLPAWRHPNLQELLVISQQSVARIGTDALKQTQYGKLRASIFHSVGDAIRYLRAKRDLLGTMRAPQSVSAH